MGGGAGQLNKTLDSLEDKRRLFERFPSRFPVNFKDTRNDFGASVYFTNDFLKWEPSKQSNVPSSNI